MKYRVEIKAHMEIAFSRPLSCTPSGACGARRSTMKPYEIRMLLDLWMSSDPWPLDAGDAQTLNDLLLRELAAYGFTDLSVACHDFSVSSPRVTP